MKLILDPVSYLFIFDAIRVGKKITLNLAAVTNIKNTSMPFRYNSSSTSLRNILHYTGMKDLQYYDFNDGSFASICYLSRYTTNRPPDLNQLLEVHSIYFKSCNSGCSIRVLIMHNNSSVSIGFNTKCLSPNFG